MKEDDVAYLQQAAKTNLLFNNPFWLHFQLQQNNLQNETEVHQAQKQNLNQAELMLAHNVDNSDDEVTLQKEMAPIKINFDTSKLNANEETALSFEPMHVVDYFASQGIKLNEEATPTDKLGKQLKSFTEWLKTMKKIHPAENIENTNANLNDITIQALAAKSNKENEIVTEAMAEVLAQQGMIQKAIEVYNKLSLLNQAKSAFFAAKIEQLKA